MLQTKDERQSHLDLTTPCEERDSSSVECRGLLAVALETSLPRGWGIHCCHACHNGKCSNWKHLYWGTATENFEDVIEDRGQHPVSLSAFKKGKDNPSWRKPPWLIGNGKPEEWSWAQEIYEAIEIRGWQVGQWGYGYLLLMRTFGLSQGVARSMEKRFKQGWIPIEDPSWLDFFPIE